MGNKEREITIFSGTDIWKSGYEYYGERMILSGFPYYQITRINDIYYFWELDLDDADRGTYRIIKKSDDFRALHIEGLALDEALAYKYEAKQLYFKRGKELIAILKSMG